MFLLTYPGKPDMVHYNSNAPYQ